jgi:hypothetical protein
MAKLTEKELADVIDTLIGSRENDQKTAIESQESFVKFLIDNGLFIIAHKVMEIIETAFYRIRDWLYEKLGIFSR